ncbi:5230_t:CDS:2 [Ambispora gerdemannii]|uniref:5230_t:CDS:1 n=1 Tax=Ambispora gerdemannii TaxID=144530 RepID=A0A9N8ZDR1_9GLOM|nr:5230_t:CDS:2 [Ambispora gerdemannii]
MSILASNFGIPTPPTSVFDDNLDAKSPFFPPFSKKNDEHFYSASPSSTNGAAEIYSPEPASPIITNTNANIIINSNSNSTINMNNRQNNVSSSRKSRSRYLISDDSVLSKIIPMIMKEHNMDSLSSSPYDNDSSSSYSSFDNISCSKNNSVLSLSTSSALTSKRKRKGTPYRSPDQDENQNDPGMIFRFPVVFSDNQSSASSSSSSLQNTPAITVTEDPFNNTNDNDDIDNQSSILDYYPTKAISTTPAHSSNGVTTTNNNSRVNTNFPQYKNTSSSSTGHFNANNATNTSFYYISDKRRTSMSLSSLSSMPTSDLSDLDADNYGDDEDDFLRNPKQIKLGTGSGLGITITPQTPTSYNNGKNIAKANNNYLAMQIIEQKFALVVELRVLPVGDLKTKCVCPNLDCRYIPLKSEFNAMFKKQKNGGDIPDAKRCCKCSSYIANNGNWRSSFEARVA